MTKENVLNLLSELYGQIYEFVGVVGDSALCLLDDQLEAEGLTSVCERWLDDEELSEAEAVMLMQCFEDTVEECEFEFGEFEDEEE